MTKSKNLQDRLNDLGKLDHAKNVLASRFLYERDKSGVGMPLELVEAGFVQLDKKYLPFYVRIIDSVFEDWGFGKVGTDTYRNCLEFLKKRSSLSQKAY